MKLIRRLLATFATTAAVFAGAHAQAAVTQLGFALDASGSVAVADYNLLRSGLSAALAALPTDGTVEITIVSYSGSVSTVTTPTILTAASLPTIQGQIGSHAKSGGTTNTAAAITSLAGLMTGSAAFADPATRSIINLATDGDPDSQSAAVAAGAAARAAGIDALSIEAIGDGVSSQAALNNMAAIAFPGPATILPVNSVAIPNPIGGSFVVPVSNFAALEQVLIAKVQASIVPPPTGVPEPGSLALVFASLAALATLSRRRAKPAAPAAMRFSFA